MSGLGEMPYDQNGSGTVTRPVQVSERLLLRNPATTRARNGNLNFAGIILNFQSSWQNSSSGSRYFGTHLEYLLNYLLGVNSLTQMNNTAAPVSYIEGNLSFKNGIKKYNIDRDRISVSGFSMGGQGCTEMLREVGNKFGTLTFASAAAFAQINFDIYGDDSAGKITNFPKMWFSHGAKDTLANPNNTEEIIRLLNKYGGTAIAPFASLHRYNKYQDYGHDGYVWDGEYAKAELWSFFQNTRRTDYGLTTANSGGGGTTPPQPPVPSAPTLPEIEGLNYIAAGLPI